MRILFLAQRVPFPPHRGDKIATYHYVRHLARRHEVSVACLADGRADLDNVAGLAPLVRSVDAVVCSKARARARALAALAGTRPLTVAYFDEPGLRARVAARLAAEHFDVALVYGSGVAQYVEPFPDLPRVIQFSDLDSLKWQQYAASTRPPRSWVYRTEARRLLAYERRLAATFSRSLVCTERELADFRRLIPGVPAEVVRNGVDLDRFRPAAADRDPLNLVFTGVMDYLPNVDGAVWFCREVLSRVRAAVPGATFTVCGSSPVPAVRALARLPGVTVTGAVPEVGPYLARAGAAVIPVRIARGVQNKLLEAMAAGRPAVTTPAAAAGVEAVDGRDLFVADGPDAFAAAVVRLLRDPGLGDRVGRAARAAVEANYSWDRTLTRLDQVIEEAARAAPPRGSAAPTAGGTVATGRRRVRDWSRRALARCPRVLAGLAAAFALFAALTGYQYGVPFTVAAGGLVRQACLGGVRACVSVYDPYQPRHARLAPDGDDRTGPAFARIETVLAPGRSLTTPDGAVITATAVHNEHIRRSPYAFQYQPFDEPRLHELRRKYRLDDIMAAAPTEFAGMVRLRHWVRSRFRRADYQPMMENFDALTVLDRDAHDGGEEFSEAKHIDPCKLFPMLYIQALLSVGHQGRLVSIAHGLAEVWSNEYRKWVVMDVELDHHFERDGVPMNMVELLEENFGDRPTRVRIVRGRRGPGEENPTMAHLNRAELDPADTVTWFKRPLDLVELRNDWMTNHYFSGHPARSEDNSLVYRDPRLAAPVDFEQRLRPQTSRIDEFYWTLNQAEILARPESGGALPLAFRTVTPNFAHYEIAVDGRPQPPHTTPEFRWRLHAGVNTLAVRSVNQFGVRGIESSVTLTVTPGEPH